MSAVGGRGQGRRSAGSNDTKRARVLWGTTRALVSNLVTGVSAGFTVNLEINGVGYRAAVNGQDPEPAARLQPRHRLPDPGRRQDRLREADLDHRHGADKQRVGAVAAKIRAFRKPEPYKGKGVKYATETIRRKEGKKK
jgi:large subunit ribosomal protein L6